MPSIPIHYERIDRLWLNETNRKKLSKSIKLRGYNWEHNEFNWFKVELRKRLRKRQKDRCCYCRRVLRHDKGVVEIEHIIDKGSNNGKYKRFCFEIKNLALSCKDCNNAKGTKKVLNSALAKSAGYPSRAKDYMWVHPHFHKYSDHIIIHKAWIYEARAGSKEGLKVIENCFLHKLADKERLNRETVVNSASDLRSAVYLTVGLIEDVGLDALCQELGGTLARTWNSTPKKVAEAIRKSHLALQNVDI